VTTHSQCLSACQLTSFAYTCTIGCKFVNLSIQLVTEIILVRQNSTLKHENQNATPLQLNAQAFTSRTHPLTLARAHSHSTAVTHSNPKALTVTHSQSPPASQSVSQSLTHSRLSPSQSVSQSVSRSQSVTRSRSSSPRYWQIIPDDR